jgi:cell division protein FtsB
MAYRSPWLRRLILAGTIALGLGWVPDQLYGRVGVARLVKLRGELQTLRAENAELRTRNARLRAELALADDDDAGAVERIARDELGLVRPGEIVFKLEQDPASVAAEPASATTAPASPTTAPARAATAPASATTAPAGQTPARRAGVETPEAPR